MNSYKQNKMQMKLYYQLIKQNKFIGKNVIKYFFKY